MPVEKKVIVGIADMAVSNEPSSKIVTYALGSCIGLSAYDPLLRIGGLIHIMLPVAHNKNEAKHNPFMFADTGLPLFFDKFYELGAKKIRLQIKIAGGASLFSISDALNVGEKNIVFVQDYLQKNSFKLTGESIRGSCARTMKVSVDTGMVSVSISGLGKIEL